MTIRPAALIILASVLALWTTRGTTGAESEASDVPAMGASPAIKLRIFYAGLLVAGGLSLLRNAGDAPYYLILLLLFAGIPILGHQTIGLTPARQRSGAIRRLWLLGVVFPLLVLALGAALLRERLA